MKNIKNLPIIAISFCLLISCSADKMELYDLKCEALNNPLGIDNTLPHISWKIKSNRSETKQKAYQILAATNESLLSEDKADLWNSQKIESDQSIWVLYAGKELSSRSLVYWKVRIWDENGNASEWSPTAHFSVGLLSDSDWEAVYIGGDFPKQDAESPLFRKTFNWSADNLKTLLHVNSLGYHELYINGEKVGDAVLSPAVSQSDKRSLILTYDVTEYLKGGENELVLWLGKGWYREMSTLNIAGGGPYVRAQLESLNNGSWQNIVKTDKTWKVRKSGYSDPGEWTAWRFAGEIVDANQLLPDLSVTSLNSVEWLDVKLADIPKHPASPQISEPNRIIETIHPVSVQQVNDSTWLLDIGKNITGWTEIKFPNLEKGQKVRIAYSDIINSEGVFWDKNDCDYYIASGGENEVFVNKFNYHAYRYIKLSNIKESPALADVSSHLIHTDFEGESSFVCSDEDINAIHDMIHYTIRCLSLGGYMVDCPHLERLGYGGDGNASVITAQTMYNIAPLYSNWMQAWKDCIREDGGMPHTAPNPYSAGGGPYWCGFLITGSWQTYINYGDPRLLERYYPQMEQWINYVERYSVDGLLKQWPGTEYRNWYLGDWATPEGIDQTDPLSVDLVANCFISQCYDTMSKIANVLGRSDDKSKYENKHTEINQLIHAKFYQADTNSYSTGTQIDLAYPMLVGATPDDKQAGILKTLYAETKERFKGHLSTGLVGVQILTEWATHTGNADWMYNMLKKRAYPGYLYMIDNGATTTWEHWNGERSHIHNCYNGIGAWFYQALGGIIPDESSPGYRHVFIKPQLVDGISWVKVSKDIPQGKLTVEWRIENGKYFLDVNTPVACTATVIPPMEGEITINNVQIRDM